VGIPAERPFVYNYITKTANSQQFRPLGQYLIDAARNIISFVPVLDDDRNSKSSFTYLIYADTLRKPTRKKSKKFFQPAATSIKYLRLIYEHNCRKPETRGYDGLSQKEKTKPILKNLINNKKMKRVILSIATVLMMGLSSFANVNVNGNEVNQQAVQSFKKDFVNATGVTWEQTADYVKATFRLNDQVLFAYYNTNGELQAVVRNIVSDQLPISLLTELKKNYSGYWISDLFEIASNDETSYYVTLENSDKKIVLKSEGTSNWGQFAKAKKDDQQ
jgi:hypothetical protein